MLKLLVKAADAFRTYSTKQSGSYIHKCFPGVPHPPKDPPSNYNPSELNTEYFSAPENVQLLVFRPLSKGEVLGPKAGKLKTYKNPEYYAYHRYSFVDLQKNALRIKMENRMLQMCPNAIPRNELAKCEGEEKAHESGDDCEEGESEGERGSNEEGDKDHERGDECKEVRSEGEEGSTDKGEHDDECDEGRNDEGKDLNGKGGENT